ncbi:MAG: hypothetical protein SPI12_02805 [Actinomycetaceae bacterium]|nr:hypothetical protein [Actinomycetaceae bacterium]MDY6082778.1 hypothetical protein [Actinomycetaceae bacterium]
MRRFVGISITVVGLVLACVGLFTALTWQGSHGHHVQADASSSQVIYTNAGVIDLYGRDVTVSMRGAESDTVTAAVGFANDVQAWAQGLPSTVITGLSNATTLKTQLNSGQADQQADLSSSDMWLQVKRGKGSITFDVPVGDPGKIAVIGTSDSGKAPALTLTWATDPMPSWAVPLVVIGGLITLIGGLLVLINVLEARQMARNKAAREEKSEAKKERAAAETQMLPRLGADVVSATREQQQMMTNRGLGAGIVPSVAQSSAFRSRPLAEDDRLRLDNSGDELDADSASRADEGAGSAASESGHAEHEHRAGHEHSEEAEAHQDQEPQEDQHQHPHQEDEHHQGHMDSSAVSGQPSNEAHRRHGRHRHSVQSAASGSEQEPAQEQAEEQTAQAQSAHEQTAEGQTEGRTGEGHVREKMQGKPDAEAAHAENNQKGGSHE